MKLVRTFIYLKYSLITNSSCFYNNYYYQLTYYILLVLANEIFKFDLLLLCIRATRTKRGVANNDKISLFNKNNISMFSSFKLDL